MNGNLISNSVFGERLYALREKAEYSTPRELALVICGYSKLEKGLIGEEAKKVDRMRRNIQNWEQGKNIPNTQMIAILCNLLDCDPDHLLYESSVYPRKEIKTAADTTGLSNKAVRTLTTFTRPFQRGNADFFDSGHVISILLENPSFYTIIRDISRSIYNQISLERSALSRSFVAPGKETEHSTIVAEIKEYIARMNNSINEYGYAVTDIHDMQYMLEFRINQNVNNLISQSLEILHEEANELLAQIQRNATKPAPET